MHVYVSASVYKSLQRPEYGAAVARVGAGIWTLVLYKNIKCSQLLSHPSGPQTLSALSPDMTTHLAHDLLIRG